MSVLSKNYIGYTKELRTLEEILNIPKAIPICLYLEYLKQLDNLVTVQDEDGNPQLAVVKSWNNDGTVTVIESNRDCER